MTRPPPQHPPQVRSTHWWSRPLGLAFLVILTVCDQPREDNPAEARAPGVIDSTLPIEEEVRRFVATVDSVPSTLRAGAPSLAQLVTRFIGAVESRDTLELRRLVLQRDEFIGVYYPHTPFTAPPYELSPSLLWFQMQNRSSQGIGRLLQRDGGRTLGFVAFHCPGEPQRQAGNLLRAGCTVAVTDSTGARRDRRLFGAILEHGGTFKFLTYANEY